MAKNLRAIKWPVRDRKGFKEIFVYVGESNKKLVNDFDDPTFVAQLAYIPDIFSVLNNIRIATAHSFSTARTFVVISG